VTDWRGGVLVLGAGSDIGRAIGRAYAKRGRPVMLAARDPERLAPDAVDLRIRHGVTVETVRFDLLETDGVEHFLTALDQLPGTVIMVAGLLGDQARAAADGPSAERVMRTNYLEPALWLGAIANRMAQRGSGVIVGISSVAGDRGRASNYIYGSAKAGFSAFLSGLRNRLAATGVKVVTVKPGFVRTRMTENMVLPARLTAAPEEVADAILAAIARGRDVVYVRPIWRLIMTVIVLVPERLFKRLKL
jgi:decaprenylphospho-beta-D-erythro-pentofuranosid-2-ulose 2-reductase